MIVIFKALLQSTVQSLITQIVLFSRNNYVSMAISVLLTSFLMFFPIALCIAASTAIRWPDWNPTVLVGLSIMTFALMSVVMDFSIVPALALSILAVNSAQSDLYTRYRYYRSRPNREET